MGSFNRERTDKIGSKNKLIPLFEGFGKDAELRGGAELEIFLMRRADSGFTRLSDYENFKLVETLRHGDGTGRLPATPLTLEPEASQFETQSRPHPLSGIHFVAAEIATHRATIVRHARTLEVSASEINILKQALAEGRTSLIPPERPLYRGELVACPFAVMPFSPREAGLCNIISARDAGTDYSNRPRILIDAIRPVFSREASLYPVSNIAVHFTHGAHSLRHAFEMTRLQAALLPFLMILTENRPPYRADSPNRLLHHTGIHSRLGLSTRTAGNKAQRGLLPDFMFAARDEHDFLDRMLDTVLNAPLLAYYDHDGNFRPAPPAEKITPLAMNGHGPEDIAQFELAMSSFWWSFKYKLPRGGGLLHELRDFDSGPEVVNNISLIAGLFGLNDAARAHIIGVLERDYGIPLLSDPEETRRVIRRNLYGAYHRGNPRYHPEAGTRHMLVPFGARGHTMLDFLRRTLLPVLEQHYHGTPAAANLDNLRFVAHTGMTNTQLWYDTMHAPEQMTRAIHEMTAPDSLYNHLADQTKSWAQHYDEGNLPMPPLRGSEKFAIKHNLARRPTPP